MGRTYTAPGAELLDKEIDKYVMLTVEHSNDPLKTYIALHSGNSIPDWQKKGDMFADWIAESNVKYLARVAAAYEWKTNNPTYAPKKDGKPPEVPFPIDDINRRAEELLNDPVFKKHIMLQKDGGEVLDAADLNKQLVDSPDAMVKALIDPITGDLTREEQIAALTELRSMGDILDHCNGAHEKYKNFFFALKDLGRLDFSKIDRGELGAKLKQIQSITEKSMEKRYTRMLWKAKNEQFDQALDVLAILKKTGKPSPFAKWADGLVEDVNRARDNTFFKQPHVTLEGRDLDKTAKRLARVRKVVSTSESNTLIGIAEKQLRKQPRASSVTPATKLPKLPKDTKPEETIDLAAKKKELDEFIQLKQGVAQKEEQNQKTRSEKEDERDKELGKRAGEHIKGALKTDFEPEDLPARQKDDDALHTGKLSDRLLEKPEPEQQIDVTEVKNEQKRIQNEANEFNKTVKQTELGGGGKLM